MGKKTRSKGITVIAVDKKALASVIGMANSYNEDLESGLEEGIYEEGDPKANAKNIKTIKAAVKKDVGIYGYLDASTRHVSKRTMAWLAVGPIVPMTIANYDYGCFISVPQDPQYHKDVPDDLCVVLNYARAMGCYILRLDADGSEHKDLPTFNW